MAAPQPTSKEKFYFDLHNFDEHSKIEEEAPNFSEDELEAAKKTAFEEGRQQGLTESAKSREQQIANALAHMKQSFAALFASEADRDKQFEEESVRLTLHILKTLFPLLNKRYGMEELKSILHTALQRHEEETEIVIDVHPDIAQDIEKHLGETETKKRYRVKSNDTIPENDCGISWKDGGAVRRTHEMVDEICRELEKLLGDSEPSPAAQKEEEESLETPEKADLPPKVPENDKTRAEDDESSLETEPTPDTVGESDDGEAL